MNTIKRKCQSCGNTRDRLEMIKITKTPKGLVINPDSKTLGRSMYVCKNLQCVKNLIKKKRIKSALKYGLQEEIERVERELLQFFE